MKNRLTRIAAAAFMAAMAIIPAATQAAQTVAEAAIPGLAGASLRPGWITPSGSRMIALDLQLEPGWKTYWRAPGDSGIAPQFDWTGSSNLGPVAFHWPSPQVIDSGGSSALGFHDRLVLPIEVAPSTAGTVSELSVAVDFGLCREVCVPAHVTLSAPAPEAAPDPVIEAALADMPKRVPGTAACTITPIADGLRIEAAVKQDLGPSPKAAMEVMSPPGEDPVWVSETEIRVNGPTITTAADFIPASGKPFDLDPKEFRLTLIGTEGNAVQIDGCAH